MVNYLRAYYYLRSAIRRAYWPRKKLMDFQNKRLREIIRHAYENVPFYHEKFKKVRAHPDDVKTLDDLQKLPIVRKDELRRADPSMLVSIRYDISRLKVSRTSGSTGKPFKFYISDVEDDWRKAIYLRANIRCGQRPRDRWVFVTSPRHFGDTTKIQRQLGIFAQKCTSIFYKTDVQVRLIREAKPDVLDGYSGALYLIGRYVEREGISDINPKLMFGSADFIDLSGRRFLEKVFSAPYYDQFGCSEVDRSDWECPERIGYHMDVDSVVTQFVDADGEEVSAGEKGEVVYTSLFNYAMPLIRYAVGDVGQPSDDVCPCGRVLPLMKVVEGKKDSFIILSDGRVISPRAFVIAMRMFKWYHEVDQFRIVQKSPSRFEFFIKRKVCSVNENVMAKDLAEHFRNTFKMDDVSFDVKFVDEIPLGKSGKLSSVVSEVKF